MKANIRGRYKTKSHEKNESQDNQGGVIPVKEELHFTSYVERMVHSLDQQCGGGRRVIKKRIG